MLNDNSNSKYGLSTTHALSQLYNDIDALLSVFKDSSNRNRYISVTEVIRPPTQNALLSGTTIIATLFFGFALFATFILSYSIQSDYFLLLEALTLWSFVLANFLLALNENYLRSNEVSMRIACVLEKLKRAMAECDWEEKHYPNLCAPFSPCVTLQWTYRDGKIVNLPWALLVRGDVIVMRPGQSAPGRCESAEDNTPPLLAGQIYQPQMKRKETFTMPRTRLPYKNKIFKMCETPYIANLRMALKLSCSRPVTVHNKQRHLLTLQIMEGIALPSIVIIVIILSLIRHFYLHTIAGTSHWTDVFLLQVVATALPFLQIMFPTAWIALNCYGMTRFKHLLETTPKFVRTKSCSISEEVNDPLLQAFSESNINAGNIVSRWSTYYNILVGKEDMIMRTANIVQVLGSLSALCCVDKKGILSWPNPTAEKVFFLRSSNNLSRSSSKTSFNSSENHGNNSQTQNPEGDDELIINSTYNSGSQLQPSTAVEVLDLTHDQSVAWRVEWDDARWRGHISRLKPLGLAALLNTCAPQACERYAHFGAHIAAEARLSEDLVPVTNRRCLCELAKQIGFNDDAALPYSPLQHLATFRHLQADTIRRDTRFARSLHLNTKVKVPLPHMLGVIVKDHSGQLQLMSQGTADIILDSCIDYWNGHDLWPLTASDRKKILDFYQRSSLTAYCTAFAYKPLSRSVNSNLASMYLELPNEWRQPSVALSFTEPMIPLPLGAHFHSTDSLLFNDVKGEDVKDLDGYFELQCNQVFLGMVTMQYQARSDVVELIERLERACIRFVHFSKENELRSRVFSEKMGLESGWNCHISLLSDTDSKPATPGGSQTLQTSASLETANAKGDVAIEQTNSVKSKDRRFIGNGNFAAFRFSNLERSRCMSASAPGAINVELSTVKFEPGPVTFDVRNNSLTTTTNVIKNDMSPAMESTHSFSDDSVLAGGNTGEATTPPEGCRSLSCLTDSTEQSAPVNFDMRNRAKLPRGIENIRPHIERVDNVPLLVSLFTDCTASVTRKMIEIMQDYNEVVCVLGSAANKDNMEIFMQADASVAVEPLYPVLCQKMPPYQVPEKCVGPIEMARILNSVSCSISTVRESDVSIFSLVTMSRHFMMCIWNTTQFWTCCLCSVTLLQLLSIILALPLTLSTGNVLWLCIFVIPLLSTSLTFAPLDSSVMQRATGKVHNGINLQAAVFVLWCYGLKFIPAILMTLMCFAFALRSFCVDITTHFNTTECTMVYPALKLEVERDLTNFSGYDWHGWGDLFYDGYIYAQHVALFLIVIHLIVISLSFIHREHSIWKKGFWKNKVWMVSVIVIVTMQCVYSLLILSTTYGNKDLMEELDYDDEFSLQWWHFLLFGMTPVLTIIFNELIKWQEIKANLRYQRRARLDFGTKLGMNSPF